MAASKTVDESMRGGFRFSKDDMSTMIACHKMVDASIRMQCNHCNVYFLTTEFYDHVKAIIDVNGTRGERATVAESMRSFPQRGSSANVSRPHNRTISSIRCGQSRNLAHLRGSATQLFNN